MAAKESKNTERTYNVPLRKEYLKVANWRRTEKAVTAVKEFLVRHMKSKEVKLSKPLNEKLWEHGIKNPPHHVKITVSKDENGVVRAKLYGEKDENSTPKKKETKKVKATKTPESKVKATKTSESKTPSN